MRGWSIAIRITPICTTGIRTKRERIEPSPAVVYFPPRIFIFQPSRDKEMSA
jgi:hypothetical protein